MLYNSNMHQLTRGQHSVLVLSLCRLSFFFCHFAAGSLAHKCTADSNANALDGALDAMVAFLGKADEDYAQRCV